MELFYIKRNAKGNKAFKPDHLFFGTKDATKKLSNYHVSLPSSHICNMYTPEGIALVFYNTKFVQSIG